MLRRIPDCLGMQDGTLQAMHIGQSMDMLTRKCRQAEENYESKTRVIRSISILVGLFLTIFLI